MQRQLKGLAWILFGLLLLLAGGSDHLGWLNELPQEFWGLAGLACGVIGLIEAIRGDREPRE